MPRSPRIACCLLLVGLLTAWAVPARAEEGAGDLAAALDEGQLHLARGEDGLAVDSFRRAVRISGEKSFPAWAGLTDALTRVKRYADAIETARKTQAAAITPEERTTAAFLLGTTLLASDDAAVAIPLLRQVVAAPGSHQKNARRSLVGALLLTDHPDEAAEVIRAYRAAGATEGEVQGLLCRAGQVLNTHGGPDKAKVAERLRALDPNAPLQVVPGVSRPQILTRVPPVYTEEARQARLIGVVIVQTVVGVDGRIADAEVLKELPMGLTDSAVEAVRQWTFQPATANGAPVPVCYLLTVNFQLQGETKEGDPSPPKPQGEPR